MPLASCPSAHAEGRERPAAAAQCIGETDRGFRQVSFSGHLLSALSALATA
ncbi:hypothetical protein [Ralstonia solanacearum]|uniref:hypothetical protein n=1 Tax=Ralstonia solanacearum TaxID=305 RepID=UPI001FFD5637|nr:hypothetical protein [Ralstonia solanacearum]